MPPYRILPYTRKQARRLGVQVRPSHNKTKKIDVFKAPPKGCRETKGVLLAPPKGCRTVDDTKGVLLASVGANGMNDYPTFIQKRGLKYAQKRRRLYKQRHEKDRHIRGSRGWYADKLLW